MNKVDRGRARVPHDGGKEASMDAYLGIDIAKRKFDVALLVGAKFKSKVCSNDAAGFAALTAWLKVHGGGPVHVCMEATGTYGVALAEYLYDQGHRISIVNPAQIKAFGQSLLTRNKTDASDAKLIARFAASHHPPPWQPPPLEVKLLQALVRRLAALQEMQQQEQNRLATADPLVQAAIARHLQFLAAEIDATRRQIHDHIDHHPGLKQKQRLLDTIPGIGEATIAQILAFIGEPTAFASARQLAAFVGLSPRQQQSGTAVQRPAHISKTGSAALRRALYMPAVVACRYNPIIKAFCTRLKAAGKPSLVIVVAAMRKLLHIVYGVLKSRQPFNPRLT
jgi:transposase